MLTTRALHLIVLIGLTPVGLAAAHWRTDDWVIYNHSSSMPTGFYHRLRAPVSRGSIVTVRAVDVAPDQARRNAFTGRGDRFIKRVAAVGGDNVCAEDHLITINGRGVARRRAADPGGHRLPAWTGCRRLEADELLLLGQSKDSFDGRYWGITVEGQVEGVWRRLAW